MHNYEMLAFPDIFLRGNEKKNMSMSRDHPVGMRKYANKGAVVMAVAGEVTRLSPTPILRSTIILKDLSMSIDENNNYKDGKSDDEHAHCVLGFIHSSPDAEASLLCTIYMRARERCQLQSNKLLLSSFIRSLYGTLHTRVSEERYHFPWNMDGGNHDVIGDTVWDEKSNLLLVTRLVLILKMLMIIL